MIRFGWYFSNGLKPPTGMFFLAFFGLKLLVFVTRKDWQIVEKLDIHDAEISGGKEWPCLLGTGARLATQLTRWCLAGTKDRRPVKFHISPLKRGQPSCFRGDLLIFGGQGMKIIGSYFHAGFLQFLGVFQVIKANPGLCYKNLGK